MTDLADRFAGRSPEQRARVEQHLAARRAAARRAAPEAFVPWPEGEPAPLSSAQQRLWFLERLEPGTALYSVPVARRLRGPLDADALRDALSDVVARHDALRARFEETPEGVVQRAEAPAPLPLPVWDASHEADPEGAALDRIHEEAVRPFDLTAGPLVRVLLVRLADDDHLLLLTLHHIVFDGGSLDVLFRELSQAYAARVAGEPPVLPPLLARYADFAAWQARRADSADVAAHLAYWTEHLAGLPALDLPVDRSAPDARTPRGGTVTFSVPAHLVGAARALAREQTTTLFVALLAAFEALLARVSGQDDFAVTFPVAGRHRPEFQALVGFFVETVAVRADVSGEVTFRDLVARVREEVFGALEHQQAPFDRVVQAVQTGRGRPPVLQTAFTLRYPTRSPLALAGVDASQVLVDTQTAKFDLEMILSEVAGGMDGRLTYAADLFDAATAERLAGHFTALLDGLLAEPDRAVVDAPLRSPAEQRQLDAWNDTAQTAPGTIPSRFREHAERAALHVAIEDGRRTWTYAALDAWSDRLAAQLQRAGVLPGARVGICAERSAAFVAGMLAAAKAGAAYVPLDPAYPAERLAGMAEDAGLAALLVGGDVADHVATFASEGRMPPPSAAVGRRGRVVVALQERHARFEFDVALARLRLGPRQRSRVATRALRPVPLAPSRSRSTMRPAMGYAGPIAAYASDHPSRSQLPCLLPTPPTAPTGGSTPSLRRPQATRASSAAKGPAWPR